MRMARLRTSGENLFVVLLISAPLSQKLEPPANPARFIPSRVRTESLFNHIDMGFLNRRLAISALGPIRDEFFTRQKPGSDHMTILANDHLLVTMLIDLCSELKVPTLAGALSEASPRKVFMSTERLSPCPAVYDQPRATQEVISDIEFIKPVRLEYHTEHIVSSTGRMTLAEGYVRGYVEAIIGVSHDKSDHWLVEPIVIGAPFLGHPRNKSNADLMWFSKDYGEILPEDIIQFEQMAAVKVKDAAEWLSVMKNIPEATVKEAFATLLGEPAKKDWGGEENDHFSANVMVGARRCTGAFLLKGPTNFREMTPAMCGKNGDQLVLLANSGADVSIVPRGSFAL